MKIVSKLNESGRAAEVFNGSSNGGSDNSVGRRHMSADEVGKNRTRHSCLKSRTGCLRSGPCRR